MKTKFSTLETLAGDLDNLYDHTTTLMLGQEGADFEIEYASTEKYTEKMDHSWVKVGNRLVNHAQVVLNNGRLVISPLATGRRKLKHPKIQLKKNSGGIKDFLNFWSQSKGIHDDKDTKEEDMFQYLIQATADLDRKKY